MVVTKVFAKIRAVASAALVAGCAMAAHPALANSSAASADISAPLRAAQASVQSSGSANANGEDEQFRNVFSSWKNYEETGLAAARPRAQVGAIAPVSIPSRNPLDHSVETSAFGMREHPILGRRMGHTGIDLAAPIGTPVYAPADGVVSRASMFSSYGLFISIEHGGELETRYGHLSRLNVAEGQVVHKGDLIGFVGTTGRSTGPHLHYEVRVDGTPVNPAPYLHPQFAAGESETTGG